MINPKDVDARRAPLDRVLHRAFPDPRPERAERGSAEREFDELLARLPRSAD